MLKNSLTNSKAKLKAVNSRMNHAEKQISHLKDRIMEITQSGQETEYQIEKKKNGSSISYLWDNRKHANLHIIGILKGKEREKGTESVFEEIRSGNFPKLKREANI